MNSTCPKCGQEVVLASVENIRNNKWTVLPLEIAEKGQGTFYLDTSVTHSAVDMLDQFAGDFPIALYTEGPYTPHAPSHYLEVADDLS